MGRSDLLFLRKGELIVGPRVVSANGVVQSSEARIFITRLNFDISQDKSSNANKAKIIVF